MLNLDAACAHLKSGGVIAYPTETVWGLGVDATSTEALEKLRELKGREACKAMSVLVANVELAKRWVHMPEGLEGLLDLYWPGPLTLVLPVREQYAKVAEELGSSTGELGLRCSSHPLASRLASVYQVPIVTTSANKSGQPPASSQQELGWLPNDVLVVHDNSLPPMPPGAPSTVVRVKAGQPFEVLREGAYSVEEIAQDFQRFGVGRPIEA